MLIDFLNEVPCSIVLEELIFEKINNLFNSYNSKIRQKAIALISKIYDK